MHQEQNERYTAFGGARRLAVGGLVEVALACKAALDSGAKEPVLIFGHADSRLAEVDLRGSPEEVARRIEKSRAAVTHTAGADESADGPRGPGRPRLGVVGREVTLLPRHWDWLNAQPGGASVTLRKLVDQARKTSAGKERRRQAQESAYRFMSAMAGDYPGYEEACRALFAGDAARFETQTAPWPPDVAAHAKMLAGAAFEEEA